MANPAFRSIRLPEHFSGSDACVGMASVATTDKGPTAMLRYALIFLVIALIAAALGFGGLAGTAVGIAKLLFYIFIILFVVGLIMHLVRGNRVV